MNSRQFVKRSCSCSTAEGRQRAGNCRGTRFSFQLSQQSTSLCGTRLPRSWQPPLPGGIQYSHTCEVSDEREGKAWVKETQKEAESLKGWLEELSYPRATQWCTLHGVTSGILSSLSLGVVWYYILSVADAFHFPSHGQLRKQGDITDYHSSLDPGLRHAGLVCKIHRKYSN